MVGGFGGGLHIGFDGGLQGGIRGGFEGGLQSGHGGGFDWCNGGGLGAVRHAGDRLQKAPVFGAKSLETIVRGIENWKALIKSKTHKMGEGLIAVSFVFVLSVYIYAKNEVYELRNLI